MVSKASNIKVIVDKIGTWRTEVKSELHERGEQIDTATLAILSRRHHFQGGTPGVAKSLLVERIVQRIAGLDEEHYFRWLLTKQSVMEELYGGWDLGLLKDHNIMKRNTFRKIPQALFVFADECFRGNGTILNANLTAMNERLFFNVDDDPHIPLISFFAAANSIPGDDDLQAFWDRLDFRHWVNPIAESSNLVAMLKNPVGGTPKPVIHIDEIYRAQELIPDVEFSEEIYEAILDLRAKLAERNLTVTDRRWANCMGIIKAEAFVNGRMTATIDDLRPLAHVLWTIPEHYIPVRTEVFSIADPIDRDAYNLIEQVQALQAEYNKSVADQENKTLQTRVALECHTRLGEAVKEYNELVKRSKAAKKPRRSEAMADLRKLLREFNSYLAEKGFGEELHPSRLDD
jgi:MoxR-like ATPase